MTAGVPSPCVGRCRVAAGACAGCRRTLEEIAAWRDMGERRRREVLARLSRIHRDGAEGPKTGRDGAPVNG